MDFGAGVYEEFVFRFAFSPFQLPCYRILLQLRDRQAYPLIVVISRHSLLAYHYWSPTEHFNLRFLRFAQWPGIYFGMIFMCRGFGITAGSHCAYDVIIHSLVVICLVTCEEFSCSFATHFLQCPSSTPVPTVVEPVTAGGRADKGLSARCRFSCKLCELCHLPWRNNQGHCPFIFEEFDTLLERARTPYAEPNQTTSFRRAYALLYQRALHPELFKILATEQVSRRAYDADIWLVEGGHVVTFTAGKIALTEVIATQHDPLLDAICCSRFLVVAKNTTK